jgi:hypothetical protein
MARPVSCFEEKAEDFVDACARALSLKQSSPTDWKTLCVRAAAQQFRRTDAAAEYAAKRYRLP